MQRSLINMNSNQM